MDMLLGRLDGQIDMRIRAIEAVNNQFRRPLAFIAFTEYLESSLTAARCLFDIDRSVR